MFWTINDTEYGGNYKSTSSQDRVEQCLVGFETLMGAQRQGGLPIRWPASPQVSTRIPVVLCQPGMEGDAEASLGDRPFPCHTCAKKYLRKNNLEDHVLMEHPDTDQVGEWIKCRGRSSRCCSAAARVS